MTARLMAIVLFFVFGLGLLAGVEWTRSVLKRQMAELKLAHANEQLQAAQETTRHLQLAKDVGDALVYQVAQRDEQIKTLTKEKRDALKNATSGRACLGAAALRVLDGAAGLRVADLPQATGDPAAADGRVATDSDIGQWALGAGAQYEQCRARLGGLIQWHGEQPR